MSYRLLADLVVGFHFAFVVFVVAGGLLIVRWPRVAWIHLPAAAWGVLVEFVGWVCPLTPLEIALRARAGQAGYEGGFIEHYLLPVLYPGLDRRSQFVLGGAALAVNVVVYWLVLRTLARRRRSR
jgi:hypothetical protein